MKRIIRWVRVKFVRHWRSGKLMSRKDGKDFVFPVFERRKSA